MKKPNTECLTKLANEYASIRRDHPKVLLERSARVVLGSSVIRVFNADTKDSLLTHLADIDVDTLLKLKSQEAYRKWFERELTSLARVIKKTNKRNKRVHPGLKWGHASKVLCLYVRDVVLCSRHFKDADAKRIGNWLYVPIDGFVMRRLEKLGVKLRFRKIKEVTTSRDFHHVQDEILGKAAGKAGVPRIWFDDVWVSAKRQ